MQAKKLIDQVRDAIGVLCTSSNLIDPKAAPLREALLRLKQPIDELIKAVSQEGMHSADEESPKSVQAEIPSDPKRLTRIALPGAPFTPETRPISPARKKKKRKGFWFRGDSEKEPPS